MMKNTRLIGMLLTAALLLLIPFVAMQFTDEVQWSAFDFMVMGALLLGTGIACEMALRLIRKTGYRIAACVAILAVCFVIWAELAVGIFGTPFAGS